MNQEKIGKFIASCRKSKKLTQVELAEKLGVSDKSVSKWECGKCMPDLSLFTPLCEMLDITINDLMSGEIVDNKDYVNILEKNIVNMVSNIEKKKKRKNKFLIITSMVLILLIIIGYVFYSHYEIDIKYNKRTMNCEINNNEIAFIIKGQSLLNTYHIIKEIDNEQIYFFHSTVNVYNKRRSNWEYSQSMARLLENKEVQFGYEEILDITGNKVKIYYTNYSVKEIENANEKELNDIIKNSYLMCNN